MKGFKVEYPDTKFYKLTNESENHNGFQFVDGINIDTQKFNPSGECSSGGLYFTELNKIAMWISYRGQNMKYIREVEILDDSLIYIEDNKFKADKFILHQKVLLAGTSICPPIESMLKELLNTLLEFKANPVPAVFIMLVNFWINQDLAPLCMNK